MAIAVQKITGNTKTEVSLNNAGFQSMLFANNHASSAVTIDLYITDQTGTNITDTTSAVNLVAGYSPLSSFYDSEGTSAKSNSIAIAIDNDSVAGTSDIFLNEKVWKDDSTLIGTCTTFGSATSITFGGGIEVALANNNDLYTGTRFYILNNVIIPNGVSLKLDKSELGFDTNDFNLYILSDSANGNIDITTRYYT